MSTRRSARVIALFPHLHRPWLALSACALLLLACTPPGSDGAKPSKVEAKPTPKATPDRVGPPAPENDEGVSSPELAAPPPWFTPDAFEHAAIVRQDQSGTRLPTGQLSAMILLELPADTTPEQCIERATAKLGETVSGIPAAKPTPQGYLELQGKADNYGYSVVCGVAKDKPTMFLSYNQ